MSVATLTDEPLDKMDCIENAPSIRAIVIGKGEDFGNVDGMIDGSPVMPQVCVGEYCDWLCGCLAVWLVGWRTGWLAVVVYIITGCCVYGCACVVLPAAWH